MRGRILWVAFLATALADVAVAADSFALRAGKV